MKIYVMTKSDETVSVLDNSISGALHYFDDEFHRYLESGASTFDLSIAKKHMMYSNASTGAEDDFQYLKENHFLVFTYKNRDYKFTIRRVEETESSLRLYCEDLSFDLLNEYRGPYKADKAYPISKYVNDCLVDSGYEIGINEFTKNERTLEWEGDQTVLKRLLSICNSFEAEIEFETILNDDRTVDKQLVHLRKRVGMDRPDVELKYGRDVSSIRRNVDLTELITGIKPRGHEEDNKVVTIKNVEKEIKDEDGNIVFYTKKGSEYIYAPMANQEYGNPKRKDGGYIVGQFSYDTKSDAELFNRALTELQKKCVPAYEFEIEGFYDVDIGDTIRAIDEGYNPILLLEARISEQVISFSDPTKNKTVYSNYRILQNKVSQSLLDRIDEVKKYAEQVAKTYIFSISNVGSPMFKNGEGEVIFTAKIEKNNQDMTGEFTKFNWIKQKKDGSLDTIWNAAHQGIAKSITVKPKDFEDTATFSYEALQDDLVVGGASGVVTKVFDGENGAPGETGPDGKTSYLHIKYSDDGGKTLTANNGEAVGQWLGQYVDFTQADSTDVSKYAWSKIKGDTGERGVAGAQGPKGDQGIAGPKGADGRTQYTHIAYADNASGGGFSQNPTGKAYIGMYVDFEELDSSDPTRYAWSLIKGADGEQGVAGPKGEDGRTPYFHTAYTNSTDFGAYDYSGNPNLMHVIKASDFRRDGDSDVLISDVGYNSIRFTTQNVNNIKAYTQSNISSLVSGKTYTISAKVKIEEGTTGNIDQVKISYRKTVGGTILLYATATGIEVGKEITIKGTGVVNYAINDLSRFYLSIWVGDDINGSVIVSDIKIEEGTTATPYQPNLLDAPYYLSKVALGENIANKDVQFPITSTEYCIYSKANVEDYKANQKYVVTMKATKPATQTFVAYLNVQGTIYAGDFRPVEGMTDVWQLAFTVRQADIDAGAVRALNIYQCHWTTKGACQIDWLKIEKGDTRTPNIDSYKYLGNYTDFVQADSLNPTKYAWSLIKGSDGKPGSNGVSVSSVVEEYYVSTSDTEQTGGEWSTTVPNNANPNLYVWRRVKNTMSDGTVSYTTPALIQGMTGIYPYIGPTQPANPKEGQQWWKSDSSGNITNFYVYKSGSWQGQTIQQSVLNIIALNAVTITGSTITGTRINGGVISGTEIHSGFYTLTYKDAPLYIPGSGEEIYGNGTMIISLGEISDSCTVYKEGSTVPLYDTFMHLKHNKIRFFKNAPAPSYQRLKHVEIGYDGLYITNEENFPGYNAATLTFQDLMTMPATLIPASSGFSQYATSGDNAPLVSRQGRVVQLSGAFKNNAVLESGASGTMGTLPAWARPERAVLMRVQASYNNTYLLTINTNGTITMSRHAAGANNVSVPAGSWLNIAIVYAAADI